MKNFSILTLLATLLFVGCSDIFVELESPLTNETTLPDLTANFADDGLTRTYVEAGKYLRWHEADLITAFFGNTLNRQYKFNGATGANSGTFSLVPNGELGTGNTLDAIYAIYPYDASATISDEGLISLTLPSEQSYAENSFGKGANTMVAVTESVEDTFLSFKNACGYLKLYLYNVDGATLKSVSVKGNNNEKIAGAATVAMTFGDTPEVTMSNDATTAVTLDCGEGIALSTTSETATALWIVLPETTFEKGITITVTDTEGGIFEKSTSNSVAITRNDIQPMAALAVEFVAPVVKPANNEIYYTNGSTTEATTPNKTDVFGVNIVSNTYDAEKKCWVIKFGGEVTTIGDDAFSYCSSLTSVTIPESVTTIGSEAFYYCSSLTSVNIPDSVTSIGYSAFKNCRSLTGVYYNGDLSDWCNIDFEFYSGGTSNPLCNGAKLYINNTEVTEVAIPSDILKIKNYTFYGCSSLTSVTIPDSVTSIGYNAFYYCSSLTGVYYNGDLSDWCNIDFYSGTSNPLNNGAKLYINNTEVTEVTIPSDISEIKNYTFLGCSSLTTITIPDSVTSIGSSAFRDCSSLTSITIPDSVTSIGYGVFYGCSNLTSVIIPESITTIESYAFCDCSGLTSVTIPDSVTSIGEYAFYKCSSLTSVYCKATTPPTGGVYMFFGNASGLTIYVPTESVNAYKSASYWSDYADYIVGYDF